MRQIKLEDLTPGDQIMMAEGFSHTPQGLYVVHAVEDVCGERQLAIRVRSWWSYLADQTDAEGFVIGMTPPALALYAGAGI
ncbi:MAG TPA: hypothetical protein VM639_24405 [Dongiaceae bacterium]|nr:hypothetical protein [Dongiaceae bacterium]